jgi:RNase P/RNase MRP subunit p29
MKSMYLRSGVALACALALAACGGDNGNLLLGGSVIGLTKEGLVLQDLKSSKTVTVPANAASFAFPDLIGSDQEFEVTVKTQPSAAHCDIDYGKGTSGAYNITSIVVRCITNAYDLGGTISGLTTDGLVLINGSERVVVPAGAKSFIFTKYGTDGKVTGGQVPDGAPYGVTILTQPAGHTCILNKGTGTMGSANSLTSIAVSCV